MKKIYLFLAVIIITALGSNSLFAQGATCGLAEQVCGAVTQPANTTGADGGQYGCLITTPKQSWLFVRVGTSGSLNFTVSHSVSGTDVDFAAWGPFTGVADACQAVVPATSYTNQISCNYSTANGGTISIPNAIAGEFYMILITNYSGTSGNITLGANTGTGTITCTPPGTTCSDAQQICNGISFYANTTGADGGTYGCLGTTPKQTWLYVRAGSSGSLSFPVSISPTADIDFAAYGGYDSVAAGCSVINGTTPQLSCNYTTANGGTVSVPSAVAGKIYIILITNYSGASGVISIGSNTGTASISCVPPPAVTLTATPTTLCAGGSITLSSVGSDGTPSYTHSYTGTTGTIGAVTYSGAGNANATATVTGLAAGTHTFTVTLTDNLGSTATSTKTVTVNAAPTAGITNNTGTTVLTCTTTSINVTATGGTSYLWTGGSTPTTAANTFTSAGTYTVTVTDAAGCTATSQIIITSDTTPPAAPTGSLAITNSTCGAGCTVSGGSILIGTVTGTGGTLQYSTNGGTTWSPSIPSYAAPQTIIASVLGTNGCRSASTTVGTTVAGTCTNPTFTGTASCSGGVGTGVVSQSATGGVGPYTYAITGGSFSSLANGTYTVTVTDSNGCSSTASVTVNCVNLCPDLTAQAPVAQVINSTCTTVGGTPSGGLVSSPATACPAGSDLQYSTNGGTSWSTTVPTYDQDGPAQTILTRCLCTVDMTTASPTATVSTVPGTCPAPFISLTDPCNCTNGIDLNGDGQNELAQETITITGNAPITVTSVVGSLVDATGTPLTPAAATALVTGANPTYTITAYVVANGSSTYTITVDANGAIDSLTGGPCTTCPAAPCNADNGTWNVGP